MAKYAIVVMSEHSEGSPGGQGRMIHALSAAKALKNAGEDVTIWFHGLGVTWLSAFDARYDAFTRHYGPLFDEHSTAVIAPELLAALAQVESSGNPVARTYWRWRFSWNPFELYGPASSAVGMFQITAGTFAEARRYCIHDHVVVEDGPWYDPHSCWFNALYTRVVSAHAVEMTAALLDRTVARILARNRMTTASLQQRQNLAAIIHLCGDGAGDEYARRGFRFRGGQRCGDHDPRRYLAQVNALKRQFARLAAAD